MANKNLETIESKIIYESPLLKRGKYQNTFKEKWFVLLQNNILVYYSSEDKAKLDNGTCAGTIDLKDVHNFTILSTPETKTNLLLPNSSYLRMQQTRKSSVIDQIRIAPLSNFEESKDTKDSDCFAMQFDTPQRTYILGTKKHDQFKQWLFLLENMIFGGIIHCGYLMKQGGKWKSWKKRWFNLDKKLLLLKYYETDKLKIWKGSIDLSLVTNLCRGDKESNGKQFTIELNTNDRVWILAANDEENRVIWIKKLKNVIDSHTEAKFEESMSEHKQPEVPQKKGVRFGAAVSSPKTKGVRFTDSLPALTEPPMTRTRSKCGVDYNLDDVEDSVRSVSDSDVELSDISKDIGSIIIHDNKNSVFQIHHDKKKSKRLRSTISVLIKAASRSDSDEYLYDDSSSSSLGTLQSGSLDEYDGSLASSVRSPPGVSHDEVSWKYHFPTKSDHVMPDFTTDDSGRFGHTSQISVEKWDPEVSPSPYMSRNVTPSPIPPLKEGDEERRRGRGRNKGYLFRGLKTQFMNVHDVELNNEEEEDGKSSSCDSDSDSSERSMTRVRRNTLSMYEEEEKRQQIKDRSKHMKTRSVMRTVEFDERFRKIYRKKKNKQDLRAKMVIMTKGWNELCGSGGGDEWCAPNNTQMTSDACVARVAILLNFYHFWIYNFEHKDAISDILSTQLNGFSLCLLLNDFHHIKREYDKQTVYLKLFLLQQTAIGSHYVDIESCIMLLRCHRDKVKMASDFLLRRSLYFLSKCQNEAHEVVTQQVLDSIYCFIFYGEYFSSADSTSLRDTINVYEKKKWRNILYKYCAEENVALANKFCSSIKYENELAQRNGGNKNNIFGVNMRYGTRLERYYLHHDYRAYFGTMKEELMNHQSYEISTFQWNDMMLKVEEMNGTWQMRQGLWSKKANKSGHLIVENLGILDVHMIAITFYSHFNKLAKALLDSYHILCAPVSSEATADDIQSYTRLKHYNHFYHFGRLILESVVVFGDDLSGKMDRLYTAVNLNYQSVVSWNKLAYATYGPVSLSRQAVVSFLYNDNYQSTILELDLNGGTLFSQYVYCIDVSFISDCPYEYELIVDGGVSLGIRNILSRKLDQNADYYTWCECIFLLRICVGDIYWKMLQSKSLNAYFVNHLSKNDSICNRLSKLICNELEFDADDTDCEGDIPRHVRQLFHSYCDCFVGYCYVDLQRILYLPSHLQHLFLINQYECINCHFLCQLFPNLNFIYGYNFIFDDTFCKHMTAFLTDHTPKQRLMLCQFEQFDRQAQINQEFWTQEIGSAINANSLTDSDWKCTQSNQWKSVKFENKTLIDKYTIPRNPLKIEDGDDGDGDDEKGTK
eukprot:711366_1